MSHKVVRNAGEVDQIHLRDHHPAIVSHFVFDSAQKLQKNRPMLAHLNLICPRCGKRLVKEDKGWVCTGMHFYIPSKPVREGLKMLTTEKIDAILNPQSDTSQATTTDATATATTTTPPENGAQTTTTTTPPENEAQNGIQVGGADGITLIPARKSNHYSLMRVNEKGRAVDSTVKEITFGHHLMKECCTMTVRWEDGSTDTIPTGFYRMATALTAKKNAKKKKMEWQARRRMKKQSQNDQVTGTEDQSDHTAGDSSLEKCG